MKTFVVPSACHNDIVQCHTRNQSRFATCTFHTAGIYLKLELLLHHHHYTLPDPSFLLKNSTVYSDSAPFFSFIANTELWEIQQHTSVFSLCYPHHRTATMSQCAYLEPFPSFKSD